MNLPDDAVALIRMYMQGFGDCFLLAFPQDGDRPFYVWIDCGVLRGTPQSKERMNQVLDNLHAETGGGPDLLVVTHEHWDHLSGFDDLDPTRWKVGGVWQSWLEDPSEEDARPIRALRKQAEHALTIGLPTIPVNSPVQNFVTALLELSTGTRDAMNVASRLAPVRYLSPGNQLDDIPGVRTYVLGPPRDPGAIRDVSTREQDVYHLAQLQGLISQQPSREPMLPFDDAWGISHSPSEAGDFFCRLYWDPTQAWRSIEETWQLTAGWLAIQLANLTNNTSLVLAFELRDGRVLLFPGDAQTGNWKSWDSVTFTSGRTAAQLLASTAFYKVSHHGSHNGTLSAKGLERMTCPDLAAAMPVDQATAASKNWPIPLDALVTRLLEVTEGRLVRPDGSIPPGFDPAPVKLTGTDRPLYADYVIRSRT